MATKKNPTSKKQRVRDLIARPEGASMQGLQRATGWQAHTIRAMVSLTRKDGIPVQLVDGKYRVVEQEPEERNAGE